MITIAMFHRVGVMSADFPSAAAAAAAG